MSEWHITPDYIVNNWTDELLNLMTEKLVERMNPKKESAPDNTVSTETLAARSGGLIKVVKK